LGRPRRNSPGLKVRDGEAAVASTQGATDGVNNIFNHDPPQSNDNFPRFIYDPTGRFVYFTVKKKF